MSFFFSARQCQNDGCASDIRASPRLMQRILDNNYHERWDWNNNMQKFSDFANRFPGFTLQILLE